jgi:putative RNA 2'-phosphotransferase
VKVEELLKKLAISKDDLDWIVDTNNKKRFAYNEDETLIRASQGHSIDVNLELKRINPPHVLLHGTTIDNLVGINNSGLEKRNRQHVHLTNNINTAVDVGMRYAKKKEKLVILQIKAKLMHFNGFKFYLSDNAVYLTDNVPTKYIINK